MACLARRSASSCHRNIELDPFNALLLDRNRSLNSINNIIIKECAVGAQCGQARLNHYKESNLGRHSMVTDYGYGSRIVPLTTLDTALVELGFDGRTVAVLKIDVEGYEPAVIAGASQTLRRTDVVIVEFSPDAGLTPFVLQTTGGISRVDIDKLRAFKGQLDVIWIRPECATDLVASMMNEVARVGDLLKLAEANKVVVKPI